MKKIIAMILILNLFFLDRNYMHVLAGNLSTHVYITIGSVRNDDVKEEEDTVKETGGDTGTESYSLIIPSEINLHVSSNFPITINWSSALETDSISVRVSGDFKLTITEGTEFQEFNIFFRDQVINSEDLLCEFTNYALEERNNLVQFGETAECEIMLVNDPKVSLPAGIYSGTLTFIFTVGSYDN